MTANLAARWVATQVSHEAVVACDSAMCDALAAAGFPGQHLKHIAPNAPYPGQAQVVVVTPVVERQFGFARNAQMAPPVLARIGNGKTAILIRVVAPQGEAKLKDQLKANQRQLRAAGAGLLSKRWITASPTAKKLLLSGGVDARLIVVLTAIASLHPIHIVSFNAGAAGVSPGVQFRTAELAETNPAARMNRADYLRFLFRAIDAQPGIYHPLTFGIADGSTGQKIFRITFSAPSPLNLLGG
ncbi:MAG: hypothetical protein ACTHJW_28165 [Streptosporangiaceae bacterium]